MFGVARHAYVAVQVRLSNRGKAISLLGGLNRVGTFSGPALGGVVAGMYGLRYTFLLSGMAIGLAFTAVVFFLARRSEAERLEAQLARQQGEGESWGHVWRTVKENYRILASAGLAQMCAQTIRAGRHVIIPLLAADVLGLDVRTIGFIVSFVIGRGYVALLSGRCHYGSIRP